jgi:hypothetical protein
MSRPRIFISSTYFDLKALRADLERFMRERSFDPVLHERGSIPYGSDKKLEEYCYKEIEHCDILVSIIGGRYGTPSKESDYSISQQELKTAIDLGKQVYIFVERNVLAEYRTFDKNRETKEFKPAAVDDTKIYRFLDEVFALPLNNQVIPFDIIYDITSCLQEQWAGLFQRLLQEASRQKEILLVEDMKEMTSTLKQLVSFLVSEKTKGDLAIRDILLSNHPIFSQIKKMLNVPYRIFFTTLEEFNIWIAQRSFTSLDEKNWDDENIMEWVNTGKKISTILRINKDIFDENGRLKIFTPEEWNSNYATVEKIKIQEKDDSDDVPF